MTCSLIEFIWIWNQIQGLSLPQHHIRIGRFLNRLYNNKLKRNGLLMAFRNSGKSTLVGLFGAWILSQKPETRILILSADHSLAKKMVHHMKQIIERHPLTTGLKPASAEEWASDRFTVRRTSGFRDPSVLARGLTANMTGCRADVIICDDVEVPKTCDTASKRESMRQKLSELDYILTPGGLTLYIGTPHTTETIYQITPGGFLGGWPCLKIPLLDQNGQSAWPERYSLEKIEALKRRSGPNKFRSQMMLDPVPLGESRLDVRRLKFFNDPLIYNEANGQGILRIGGKQMIGVSCWWDPSFGSPSGDKSVVACVFFDTVGNTYLYRLDYLTVPEAEEATAWQCGCVRQLAEECFIPAIHLETNGIGKFLPALLRQEFARHRTACAVVEEISRQNKAARIIAALDAPLMNGSFWVHESVKQTPFLNEMQDFLPNGTAHDDGLDAVAGCLLSEPVRLKHFQKPALKHYSEWRF